MSILKGYRVIDCSIAMAGPLAAQRLGDMGADVIKVEPVTGEWQRHVSAGRAQGNRINVSFLSLNRNKRSIAVDMKSDVGREIMRRLVEGADVFLQNYRPGVAERLGVDYATLATVKPDLVYIAMSGYGQTGPYAKRPGQDLLLQAMSGATLSAGAEGAAPMAAGQFLVDAVAAYVAFEGALAGLLHRERTGEGQMVDVNMLDAIVTLQMQEYTVHATGGVPQSRSAEPHAHSYIRAPYGIFATSDGYISLAFAPLEALGRLLGSDQFDGMDDETDSWDHRDLIYRVTREQLLTNTTQHWLDVFDEAGIWAGPVLGYADVLEHAQIQHNGTFVSYDHPTEGQVTTPGFPMKFSQTPLSVERGAPLAGEHSREILHAIGFSDGEIEALLASGRVSEDQA